MIEGIAKVDINIEKLKKTIKKNEFLSEKNEFAEKLCNYLVKDEPIIDVYKIDKRNKGIRSGKKIVIYQDYIYKIGGIETFLLNFCKHYKNKNIILIVRDGNPKILYLLSEYVDIVKDTNQKIDCDVCILGNYNSIHILPRINSNKIYQMIHGDYEALLKKQKFVFEKPKEVDEIISVSETAQKGLKNAFGYDSKVIPNILDCEIDKLKPLIFVTLSRATAEKGIFRIIDLAKAFIEENKMFIWILCGSIEEQSDIEIVQQLKEIPNFVFVNPSILNKRYINIADYLVQLSDTESFCYSAYEALQRKVPCILTDYPEAYNTIENGKNGYIISRDSKMYYDKKLIDKIFNKVPKNITYKDRCDTREWDKILEDRK